MNKRRRYVLWGSAGHALVLAEAIRRLGDDIVALFDNSPHVTSVIRGVELVGGLEALPAWAAATPERCEMYGLVAIGGARGRDRLKLQQCMADIGLRIEPLIHPAAFVADDAVLGAGTQVLAMAVVAAQVRLGTACIVNHKALVDHECNIGDGVHIGPGATLCGCVTIGDNAMIGAGAVVLPRLSIGSDAVVGAGAVVTRDIPDGTVVIGNPARILQNYCHKNAS